MCGHSYQHGFLRHADRQRSHGLHRALPHSEAGRGNGRGRAGASPPRPRVFRRPHRQCQQRDICQS